VNSLPKTVTRQRRDCDLNAGPSAPESSTLIAKFHYTDTDTGPTRTKSAHVVGYELNSTTRARVRVRVVEFSYNHSASEPPARLVTG